LSAPHAAADLVPTWLLALVAITFTAASGGRHGIELLAWIAPVPWLLWVRRTTTWPHRLALLGATVLASVLQLSTIITPPIPWTFALMFGVPTGLTLAVLLLLWNALRSTTSERVGLYAFVALTALTDAASALTSPMGGWGTGSAGINTDLVVLQLASVLGIAGVGALMAWFAATLAQALATPGPFRSSPLLPGGLLPDALVLGVVLAAVHGFGTWRLARPSLQPTVPVAGVVTDLVLSPAGLPADHALDANVHTLFERSRRAATQGARLIVWNEGATAVHPADEAALLDRGRTFARRHDVDLVLAYIRVTDPDTLAFDNLAVFIDDQGQVLTRYHKRHPVPGETEPSDNPVPRLQRPYGTVSLAICYDADFPEMSRAHAAIGAELVAVPSSDWAGIDPVHTSMSRVRAIEGGYSLIRPVRAATSAAFDPMGRVRGALRVDEANDRVLRVDLPVGRVPTVYAWLGDAWLLVPGAWLLGVVVWAIWRRISTPRPNRRPASSPPAAAEA